jgi:CRISPR-associated protein Csm3
MDKKLTKKIIIHGEFILKTGLHIGGTNSAMGIGGPDATVIRNPITNKPIIPGSSIKGKMRTLLEINEGTVNTNANMGNVKNGPTQNTNDLAARLYGTANPKDQIASRLIVRDSELIDDEDLFNDTDLPYTESKTEVVIDRITSAANPRQIERVPAGATFSLNMVLNVYNDESEAELMSGLVRSMKLLQDDYIGGSGSRGYGQIAFQNLKKITRTTEYYKNESDENTETLKL